MHSSIISQFSIINSYIVRNFSKEISNNGLTFCQWMILKFIKINEGNANSLNISKSLNIAKGTLSDNVKKLINLGFIKECDDCNDKRKTYYLMTEKSNELCEPLLKLEHDFEDNLLSGLTLEEGDLLIQLLGKIDTDKK